MSALKTRFFLSVLLLSLFLNFSYLASALLLANGILSADAFGKLYNNFLVLGLFSILLTIILASIVSFFLARSIKRPINELIKSTEAISKRDFNQHIRIRSYREIEQLVNGFNNMAEKLRKFQRENERHSQNLEKIAHERAKELSYIYKIGREVSSTLELSEVLDSILSRTTEVLDLKVCTILLIEQDDKDKLKALRSYGINLKKIEKELIQRGEGISGWVWEKKEALLINDVDQDSRFIGRKKEKYYTGSLISVPLLAEGKIIGVINGNNKTSEKLFDESDLLLLKEIAIESAIGIENALLYKSLKEIYVHTIAALASALEAKDHYARSHSENVTKYAVAIAKELGLSSSEVETIRQACQLHDLGKIGIHDYILTKPGKLTAEEWEEVKLHALRGAKILQPIGFLNEVAELISQHHERFDGTGYPAKLSGQNIHLGARIMTAADAFDAMISERPYRKALSLQQAIAELKENSGTQFDPGIVKVFLKVMENKPDLAKRTE